MNEERLKLYESAMDRLPNGTPMLVDYEYLKQFITACRLLQNVERAINDAFTAEQSDGKRAREANDRLWEFRNAVREVLA